MTLYQLGKIHDYKAISCEHSIAYIIIYFISYKRQTKRELSSTRKFHYLIDRNKGLKYQNRYWLMGYGIEYW